MTRIALALSPHLDDAVFSCGGTLARLADAGWRVVVATLFTASVPAPQGFALACQLDKGLEASVDYMELRRHEDATACDRLMAQARWLPFPEAPHRGYESAKELFGPVHAEDKAADLLRPALQDLLEQLRPDLLLAPQAIGGHVDHVIAVSAILSLATKSPMLWWRDFPYVVRAAERVPFADIMARLDEIAVPVEPQPRSLACEAYESQLGFQFGGKDRLATMLAETGLQDRFRCERMTPALLSTIPGASIVTSIGALS
ncbi:PIG-L deacetylase family protein [Lichenicoccus roseus]|uniref:PIG-L deacetylase family protein n=1 Tax=Lichenicoccus roseus TaxID=2683649 RepID=UPI00197DA1F4|nr:PIG-L family deacetylase [Lichenicoccus roseus]